MFPSTLHNYLRVQAITEALLKVVGVFRVLCFPPQGMLSGWEVIGL